MDEILKEFIDESREGLDRLDTDLVKLESNSDDGATLDSVFRIVHTIKGTCGFLDFNTLESVTHAGENLLVQLRDGTLKLDEKITNALLAMVDAIRHQLDQIVTTGSDGGNFEQLVANLQSFTPTTKHTTNQDEAGEVAIQTSEQGTAVDNEKPENLGADLTNATHYDAESETTAVQKSDSTPTPVEELALTAKTVAPSVDSSIRVDVPLLDNLMNLVGELVLARNQIIEYVGKSADTQVVSAAQRLNLITTELQEGVMQTRMQPILTVWSRLPRVVRDLAQNCGKQVRIEMVGKDTELDKSLIEAIKDPITHLVRNTVDHGVESTENRLLANKPAMGLLQLKAFHEDGQVHIEISDDGAGIDPEKIKRKALELNVITEEQAQEMTDKEAQRLIFHAGLSTAAEVTNISGRGVGMDVVKTNIERISGTIDLVSKLGHGTKFIIQVPLTLAIVPALIVSSGNQQFAIPQMSLIELIRVDQNVQTNTVEYIHGKPVFRLRGTLLPLVILNDELNLSESCADTMNIVVLTCESGRFGLVVEHISDTQEIVVKPLVEVIKKIRLYAGAAIMGDGRIALILDTTGIGKRAGIMDSVRDKLLTINDAERKETEEFRQAYLVVQCRGRDRFAIRLDEITRLEQFDNSKIENIGESNVVQYREELMPLVELLPIPVANTNDIQINDKVTVSDISANVTKVVVFGDPQNQLGLIVSDIIDIVTVIHPVNSSSKRIGNSDTVVIQGKVTALINVDAFIADHQSPVTPISEAA